MQKYYKPNLPAFSKGDGEIFFAKDYEVFLVSLCSTTSLWCSIIFGFSKIAINDSAKMRPGDVNQNQIAFCTLVNMATWLE